MASRRKRAPEVVEATIEQVPEVHYCDLKVSCKCGRTQTIGRGIEGGLQLIIVPKEDSYVLLVCDECKAEIKLYLVAGEKPETTEEVINEEPPKSEDISQENKSEESL